MTIVDAFKEFFYKLNGTRPSGNNIADVIRAGVTNMQVGNEATRIMLRSSTSGSDKVFVITVVDDGTITATEVVAESPTEGEGT